LIHAVRTGLSFQSGRARSEAFTIAAF
jgi:hypothetical protein